MDTNTSGIARAIDKMGGQTALARALNGAPSQQAVQQWLRQGYVPAKRVQEIHALTGVAPLDLIRPDLAEFIQSTM